MRAAVCNHGPTTARCAVRVVPRSVGCAAEHMRLELLVALLVCVFMYVATLVACRAELQRMTEKRTWGALCCRREVTKPKRKLVMILTAANDFFSDALYVSTATFASPGLQAAAILFFVLPTVVFFVVGRDFMSHLAVGGWTFYKRKVHGDNVALHVATASGGVNSCSTAPLSSSGRSSFACRTTRSSSSR